MTIKEFKEYVKTGQALEDKEIRQVMAEMGFEARHITCHMSTIMTDDNISYHLPQP